MKIALISLIFIFLLASIANAAANYQSPEEHIYAYSINRKTLSFYTTIGTAHVKVDSADIPAEWWQILNTWVRTHGSLGYKWGYGENFVSPITRNITINFTFWADFSVDEFFPCHTEERHYGGLNEVFMENVTECDWIIRKKNYIVDFNDLEDAGHTLWKEGNTLFVNISLVEGEILNLDPVTYSAGICNITGSGNTLLSINNSINDSSIFFYDDVTRIAEARNCTIWLEGNLTITNESLLMNNTGANGVFNIDVRETGFLKINESSIINITALSTHRFAFTVRSGGTLLIDNSTLSNLGWRYFTDERRGLETWSSFVNVTNTNIRECKNHFSIHEPASNIIFENNTVNISNGNVGYGIDFIEQNGLIENVTIKGNTFDTIQYGIYHDSGKYTKIIGNTFLNTIELPIYLLGTSGIAGHASSNSNISNNIINGNNNPAIRTGIYLVFGNDNFFGYNHIDYIQGADCTSTPKLYDYGVYIEDGNNQTFIANSMRYNGGDCVTVVGAESGMSVYMANSEDCTFLNNDFRQNGISQKGYGVWIENANNFEFHNNAMNYTETEGLHWAGNNSRFENNSVYMSFEGGLFYGGNNITVKNFNAQYCDYWGFFVSTTNSTYEKIKGSVSGGLAEYGIYIGLGDNTFIDSDFAGGYYSVGIDDEADYHENWTITFINVTYTNLGISAPTGVEHWLDRRWWLNIYVNESTNNGNLPISNTNVTAWNISESQAFSELTNATGWITRINLTQYFQNASGKFYSINYTINASHQTTTTTDIVTVSKQLNITGNTIFNISIDIRIPNIAINNPVDGTTYFSYPTLNYSASDNYQIDQCWYNLNFGDNITLENCANLSSIGAKGFNQLKLYINDTSGNINSTSFVYFNITITIGRYKIIYIYPKLNIQIIEVT